MALSNSSLYNICQELNHKFLFCNDINSIHMLLNIYDLEDNITNIFPKYVCMDHIKKTTIRYLRKRRGNHLIALNLSQVLREDINRLELFLYLDGYKAGYSNNKLVNTLEEFSIKYYSTEELYNMNYLFHFESNQSEVLELKAFINSKLHNESESQNPQYISIVNYLDNIIKPKILSLNKHLDKQMIIEYNSSNYNIKEDETLLTLEDLNGIYKEVVKSVIKFGLKLYNDALWNGLNDRVLQRYR